MITRFLALFYILAFLLLGALVEPNDKACNSYYNDSVPVEDFKNLYDGELANVQVPDKPPELFKNFSTLIDYFRELSCGDMAVEPNSAIVNGSDAPEKAWPWQVLIRTSDSLCGGVLLSDSWVLTAAHCINESETFYEIEIGVRVTGPERGDCLFTRSAKHVIVHEKYESAIWRNDLALIKLNASVYFSERVRPACLPFHRNDFNETSVCYITGFGDGAPDEDGHTTLQQLRMYVVDIKECFYEYASLSLPIDKKRICISSHGKSGACTGDSGGPLSCKEGSRYYVVGITSFGLSECVSDVFPEVYTRTSEYINWIFSVMSKYTT